MAHEIEMIKTCLKGGGDLCDTLNTIWLEQEAKGTDLSNTELNALVLEAIKEMN